MNCKNFEATIKDLAREQMLEAATRNTALSHIEECRACAKALEAERALTAGLRRLAAEMQELQAPASLEANLLARFRERAAGVETSPAVVALPERASRRRGWYLQAVAAAVLLMFAIGGAITINMRRANQSSVSRPSAVASENSGKAAIPAKPAGSGAAEVASKGEEEAAGQTIETVDNSAAREQGPKLTRGEVVAIMGGGTRARSGYTNVPRSQVKASRQTSTGSEIATDFIPVTYGDNLNEIENGRIVRVEVPRSALAQFGLPVNMDRANERVKADVLIGDDGMARAIRFVR
jgi:hypothetical protein